MSQESYSAVDQPVTPILFSSMKPSSSERIDAGYDVATRTVASIVPDSALVGVARLSLPR